MQMTTTSSFDVFTAGNALMEATIRVNEATVKSIAVPRGGMLLVLSNA